jgi:phage terminase large subunit-like protein
MQANQPRHPAEGFIDDVLHNRIVVSSYVRKAVERHLADLQTAGERGFYFDREEALWVCSCFELFRHSEGDFAGQPFMLSPWQAFCTYVVFGWKQASDNMRRFRRVYVEVGRKNGKSTWLAAVALFMLLLDGEPSGQVYSAATKLDQSKIVWNAARKMVKASPELLKAIKIYRSSLAVPSTESTFIPLSSDSKGMDGLNISCAVVDELHAHPNADVWELIDTATGSRSQPLIWIITTAGFNQAGICFELRSFVIDILNGVVDNDQWFAFIACLDDGDKYADETCWEKANPNIRYIPTLLPDLREKASRASRSAGAMNNFLVKCLCRWTSQGKRWLKLEDWDKCKAAFTYEDMLGRPAFGGIDLAEKLDLTAGCLCFPPINEGEKWRYLWRFYLPADTVDRYKQAGDLRWEEWVKAGLLIATDGAITDQTVVRADVRKWQADFDLRQVAFDPWHMSRLAGELIDDGVLMIELAQRYAPLTEGTKEFEAQVVSNGLEHDGNQMARWMVDNACILSDNDGNCRPIRPQRNSNAKKVDGVVAAVMATSQAVRNPISIDSGIGCFSM